jgi:hypothetical protein
MEVRLNKSYINLVMLYTICISFIYIRLTVTFYSFVKESYFFSAPTGRNHSVSQGAYLTCLAVVYFLK